MNNVKSGAKTKNRVITINSYNSEKPLVSIIVPSFNHHLWVCEAIESALQQTYKNIELIVIDDGSNNETREVIRNFRKIKTNEFIYIEKQNEGIVRTLNSALRIVNGDYVAILASDDLLCPTKIEVQVDLLESLPYVDSVFCPQYEIDETGKIIGTRGFLNKYFTNLIGVNHTDPIIPPNKWDIVELIMGAVAHPFEPQSALTRANVYYALNGFDESIELDDIDFNLRAAMHGFIPRFHSEILHKVRIHDNQASSKAHWLYDNVLLSLDKFYSQPGIPSRIRKYKRYNKALYHFGLANSLRANGDINEAITEYLNWVVRFPDKVFPSAIRFLRLRYPNVFNSMRVNLKRSKF